MHDYTQQDAFHTRGKINTLTTTVTVSTVSRYKPRTLSSTAADLLSAYNISFSMRKCPLGNV